jgi:hypothetical protein
LVGIDLITINTSKRWWVRKWYTSAEARIKEGTGTYILRWRCARAVG